MKFTVVDACVLLSLAGGVFAQTPGISTNMVSGTSWPGGDPFLQRQNEPSMAVSSRNPMHLVAGDNDYRTVDLPFVVGAEETGDAWLGFFTSYDGGQTWTSTLVPGYPQDTSTQGLNSPLHGRVAGADPVVRPGTNGMFYYSGLAFNRDKSGSSIFVARYVDDNNIEGGNSIRYIDTHLVAQGMSASDPNQSIFLDKPTIAVDIPRAGAPTCSIPAGPTAPAQTISAGFMYVAYTRFTGPESAANAQIMLSESSDCGVTWSTPINLSGSLETATNQGAQIAIDPNTGNVYVYWRVFASSATGDPDALEAVTLQPGVPDPNAVNFFDYFSINPFDQGTSDTSFRTNAYPAVAIDNNSTVYVAWSQRGLAPNGDAQIALVSHPVYCGECSSQITVDPYNGPGHQIMPALAFSSGKLTVAWYDFRDDDQSFIYKTTSVPGQFTVTLQPDGTLVFGTQVADPPSPYAGNLRHTVDVRAAQGIPVSGYPPSFQPSVLVSQYAYGSPSPATDSSPIEQLEFNAPNLPLFEQGTAAFVGDYIDVAGPTFVYGAGAWRYNNLPTDPDYTHIIWTDNRNVIPPADGNWANYTPVALSGGNSTFDPSQTAPTCAVGQTGMRNQDIYTATLSPGVIMGALGDSKPLSTTLQREFAITVQNTTSQTASYRLSIVWQPVGGTASFIQFLSDGQQPVTQLDITIPALSSAARSVFITSSDPNATVSVTAQQINQPGGSITPNGMSSSVVLNPDVSNPNISNPNISNQEVYNPNISNPNISNPNISNPNISNPNISNPNISNITIANPNILNPNISNPNISNPNISNPNISNPNISNPNISNTALTDASYVVTNTGNTVATYNLQLLQNLPAPSGVTVQLIVSGIYTTPVANGCNLTVEAHYVPLVNDISPTLITDPNALGSAGITNPNSDTFVLAPGQQALVTIRAYDSTTGNNSAALQHYNPGSALTPVIVSTAANSGSTQPSLTLTVTTMALGAGVVGGQYSQPLQAIGGSGSGYTWAQVGNLPPGLNLTSAGVLQGSPTTAFNSTLTVQVTDSAKNTATKILNFTATGGVTVGTNIPGLSFTVDGVSYSSQQTFPWSAASQHTLVTTSPQTGAGGVQYFFSQWSDGGGLTDTVTAGQVSSYSAIFQTASTPMLTGPPASAAIRNDFPGFVGMKFTVGSAPINVLSLGRIYLKGNSQTHIVKLVDAFSGLDVPNASVSVTMVPGAANTYQYSALPTTVVLQPNKSYYLLTQEFSGGDTWYDFAPVTANSAFTVNGAEYQASVGSYVLQRGGSFSYVPPNMLFVGGAIVPPPVVNITSPSNGAAVQGTIQLMATATPASGLSITNVQFRLNGSNFGAPLTTTPYTLQLDTTTLLSAMNTVTAVATDSNGGTTTAAPVSFTVANSPTAPGPFLTGTPGGTLRNDYSGFVGLKFSVGGTPVVVSQLGRWVVPGNSGAHTVKLVAVDGTDVPNGSVSLLLAGAAASQYAYAALASPITLPANTTYYLMTQEVAGGDRWYDVAPVTANSAAGVVNAAAYRQNNGSYITLASVPNSYGPPNFLFAAGGGAATAPPTVVVIAPPSGSTVSGTVQLSAGATPASGLTIQSVQFRINGANVGPALTTAPYNYSLDTTTLANATDNLTAVATDSAGNTGTSSAVVLTINNVTSAPTGSVFLTSTPPVTAPLRNDYQGNVGMKFTASDTPLVISQLGRWKVAGNTGSHIVKLVQADGTDVPGGSVTVNMAGASAGQYAYAALASPITLLAKTPYYLVTQEFAGGDQWYDYSPVNASSGTVNAPAYQQPSGAYVTLSPGSSSYGPPNFLYSAGNTAPQQPPPTVVITSPAAGMVSGTITLSANATPAQGLTIVKVQFQLNGANVNSPLDTTTLANGSYTLIAMATDSAGSTGTSAGITIAVSNPTSATTGLLTGAPGGNLRNDFTGYVGLKFTVGSTPIKVSALGRWGSAGNSATHVVKLVDALTGTDVTGGSVTVSPAVSGQYNYAPLASQLTLVANHTYYLLTQEVYGGDRWYDASTVTANSAVTINGPAYQQTNGAYMLLFNGVGSYGTVSLLFGL